MKTRWSGLGLVAAMLVACGGEDLQGEAGAAGAGAGSMMGSGGNAGGEGGSGAGTGAGPGTGGGPGSGGSTGSGGLTPLGLEVEANGTSIGYLVGASTNGFVLDVVDPSQGIRFAINSATGHVVRARGLYTQNNCLPGPPYFVGSGSLGGCFPQSSGQVPIWSYVFAVDGDVDGFTQPTALYQTVGGLTTTTVDNPSQCSLDVAVCALATQTTTVIPTTFPTPIAVVD